MAKTHRYMYICMHTVYNKRKAANFIFNMIKFQFNFNSILFKNRWQKSQGSCMSHYKNKTSTTQRIYNFRKRTYLQKYSIHYTYMYLELHNSYQYISVYDRWPLTDYSELHSCQYISIYDRWPLTDYSELHSYQYISVYDRWPLTA